MKELLQSIADDVKDIFSHAIETTNASAVPGRDDGGLTFGRDQVKRGKVLETCVLFIDIRNSTSISRSLKKDKAKLGKIYTAFIHAMVTIADQYGYVRNIIGDRVMVVFEPGNCYQDAMSCAAMMYSVTTTILKKYVGIDSFKAGIGIDYGEMLVLKTGIQKRHEEKSEYKNLVWVGDAANIASKLTDFANKAFSNTKYHVAYEYTESIRQFKGFKPGGLSMLGGLGPAEPEYEWKFETKTAVVILSSDAFNRDVKTDPTITYNDKKVLNIKKELESGLTAPILMSGAVFSGFKKASPKSPFLAKLLQRIYANSPSANGGIYGGYLLLPETKEIKF